MVDKIEDINGFSNLVMIDGRSFDNLKERMIMQVRVPAKIMEIGLKPNGFPYAILLVSAKEKLVKEKKAPPSAGDTSILIETTDQPN